MLLASCSLALLSACQSGPEEERTAEGMATVEFSVTNYRQVSFDDLSSSAGQETRAMSSREIATLAHLLLTVYDAESGEQVISPIRHDHADFESAPTQYPKFSVTLPYGNYRVLVLGYNGSRACNITSLHHISWADNYVPNTFLSCEEFTVGEGTAQGKEITLRRAVAAFSVTAEDAIPEGTQTVRFSTGIGGTVLDGTTGYTPQQTGRTSDITVPTDSIGKQGVSFTVYLFLPDEQAKGSYTVQTLDKNNAVTYQKRFAEVPMRINQLTLWEGNLFEEGGDDDVTVEDGFGIQWDFNWADTLRIDK